MGPPCLFWPAQTQIHGWAEKKFSAEFAEKGRTGRGEESGHFEEAKGWAQRRDARRLCAAGATGRGIKGHGQRPGDGQQRDASFESKVWRQGQAHRRIVIPRFGADRGRKIRWGCCCLCRHCRSYCPLATKETWPGAAAILRKYAQTVSWSWHDDCVAWLKLNVLRGILTVDDFFVIEGHPCLTAVGVLA